MNLIIICHNPPLILATSMAANFPAVPRTVLESACASCVTDSYETANIYLMPCEFVSAFSGLYGLWTFPIKSLSWKDVSQKDDSKKDVSRKSHFPRMDIFWKDISRNGTMALPRNGHIEHAHFFEDELELSLCENSFKECNFWEMSINRLYYPPYATSCELHIVSTDKPSDYASRPGIGQ